MAEKNSVCCVRNCKEEAKWIVHFTKPRVTVDVPICEKHEPIVAPGSIVVDENGNQVNEGRDD